MLAFEALLSSSIRVNATEKLERAWTDHVTSQGTGKDVKKWTKAWQRQLSTGKPAKVASGKQIQAVLGGLK